MKALTKSVVGSLLVGILAACAHTPDATIHYYLPKSDFSVKVLRTVSCDQQNRPIVHVAVVGTTTYSPDTVPRDGFEPRKSLSFSQLDGAFSKSSTGVNFYPNGTLSGINAESAGQGKDIVIAALKVAAVSTGTLALLQDRMNNPALKAEDVTFPVECKFITDSSKDGVITLIYEAKVDLKTSQGQSVPVPPSHQSSVIHQKLRDMLGPVCAAVTPGEPPLKPITLGSDSKTYLWLREPGTTSVSVSGGMHCLIPYDSVSVLDGNVGTDYKVPIPQAAMFGRNSFKIPIAESGRITHVSYEKEPGAGSSLDAVSAMMEALAGKTIEDKTAELNAEADLIFAQERLAKCEADPTNCPK